MKPVGLVPRSVVQNKPAHGQPCNRCGLCCMMTLCPLAQHVFRRETGPCPALERTEDGATACGLITHPGHHALAHTLHAGGEEAASEAARWLIASDVGCDARINGEPADHVFYQRARNWDRDNRNAIAKAKKTWGVTKKHGA